jgi:glycosyl transferase family 25
VDIPIKVINLRRSADRRETFARRNAHIAYEFVEAHDGAALTEAQLADPRHFVPPLRFPSRGAYGCALSHLAQWDAAIAHDRPLTVAEDDAVFRLDFPEASRKLMAHLPPDWDFILWGWNTDSVISLMSLPGVTPAVMLFNHQLLCENMDGFQALKTPSYPLALDRTVGIPAYTISPAGARKFRQDCFPMKHFEMYFPVMNQNKANDGIDIAMARSYSVTKSFAAFPPLVATPNETGKSTIQPP